MEAQGIERYSNSMISIEDSMGYSMMDPTNVENRSRMIHVGFPSDCCLGLEHSDVENRVASIL